MASLIYSFVARGTVVLAEYASPQTPGNYRHVAISCLERGLGNSSKFTFTADQHTFNFLLERGYTYLVVATEGSGRQIPYAYLETVKNEFTAKYAEKSRTAQEGSLDKAFGPRMKTQMEWCMAHPEELSKVAGLQKKVDEVKSIMVDNIEQVLARGERIDRLMDQSEGLRNSADRFHRIGVALRRKMWWQNKKVWLIAIVILLVLIFIIFLSVCFSGGNCFKSQ